MSYVFQPTKNAFVSGAALSTLSFAIPEEGLDAIPLEDDRLGDDPPSTTGATSADMDDDDALAPTQRAPSAA
jgi:hypothetical protein